MVSTCALCLTVLPKNPIQESENGFCCRGCHAVFTILSAQNALHDYQNHPLFQQALKAGFISNPTFLESIRRKNQGEPESQSEKIYLEIQEMWCPSCAEVITLFLLQMKGIKSCYVDYTADWASIEFFPLNISKERIYAKIHSLGYRPLDLENSQSKVVSFNLYLRFIVAAFCALNIMMFSYPVYAGYFDDDVMGYDHLFAWLSFGASLPVMGYSAWPIFQRFWHSFRVGLWGMEMLVIIGIVSAFSLSTYELFSGNDVIYFDSLSVIVTFVLLGKMIESKAKFSAKNSWIRLNKALPKKGRKRFEDLSQKFVSIKEIHKGDAVIVLTGEKLVVDGIVLEGEGTCDESLITGEILPIAKKIGDRLLGGSLLLKGSIVVKVTSEHENSTLHHMMATVEKAIQHKAVYTRAADAIVRWFVPCVVIIALTVLGFCLWLGEDPFLRTLSVLLIACPCAIGIAAPLAESYLIQRLASNGVLVKNRGCLGLLGHETVFIFDKTGTTTEGRFKVLQGLEKLSKKELSFLKALTLYSIHPICYAISQSLYETESVSLSSIEELSGKGMKGQIDNESYFLGSSSFLKEEGIEVPVIPKMAEDMILSCVYFARGAKVLASIQLTDQIRNEAHQVVKSLKPAKVLLVSGDSEIPVTAVGRACGFDDFFWCQDPLQKRALLESLKQQGHTICMLGDGINDAPSLAAAHIGISVMTATDISVQVSDILLTSDSLEIVLNLRELAIRGQKILKQNLFWAFAYNVIGIGLAAFGKMSPIFAAFAMMCSSLIVLLNARRIETMKIGKKNSSLSLRKDHEFHSKTTLPDLPESIVSNPF